MAEPVADDQVLANELAKGKDAAEALVAHVRSMGAEQCDIEVEAFGELFIVTVKPATPT